MMKGLFSIYLWTYYCLLFLVFFILISIVFVITFPFDKYRKAPNFTLSIMARFMLKASPGWNINMGGIEKFDPSQPTIFVSNHQSFLDIPLIFHLPWKMKWVSKQSLAYIPVMGWMVWLTGHLTIKRSSTTAMKKLDNLVQPLKDLIPVMIFPEGTRTMDGELKPFKNGAFLMAKEYSFRLQPIVISGGYKAMPPGSKIVDPSVNFYIKVLDAIDPEYFEDMTSLKNHTYEIVSKHLNELEQT